MLKKVSDGREYGKVALDRNWRVKSFSEKHSVAKNCLVNAGVYIFNKQVFNIMPQKSKFSLEHDFFPSIIGDRIYGYPKAGFLIDMGTPERYREVKNLFIKDSPLWKKSI